MPHNVLERRLIARITNSSGVPKRLILEPWGEEYSLPVGSVLEILAEGLPGAPEFDFADECLTIYAWSGSTLTLVLDGAELDAGQGPRTVVPPTPTRRV